MCGPQGGERRELVWKEAPALLRVELVRVEGQDALFVAGVWVEHADGFERARKIGYCPVLRLSGDALRNLSAEAYAERLAELDAAGWKRVRG